MTRPAEQLNFTHSETDWAIPKMQIKEQFRKLKFLEIQMTEQPYLYTSVFKNTIE